jgi:aspartate racemase
MKTIGVIGGLGPETTAHFYLEVVFACAKKTNKRPNMLISNVALPIRAEKQIIRDAKNERAILPFLVTCAKQLERGGADFIVIPCNTVHMFIDDVRRSVRIPVLSIIEETVKFLKKRNIRRIGILATSATIKHRLFDDQFKRSNIEIVIPNSSDQRMLNSIIHRLVCARSGRGDKRRLLAIVKRTGVRLILLACTDLQLLHPAVRGVQFFDTLDILAKATVRKTKG